MKNLVFGLLLFSIGTVVVASEEKTLWTFKKYDKITYKCEQSCQKISLYKRRILYSDVSIILDKINGIEFDVFSRAVEHAISRHKDLNNLEGRYWNFSERTVGAVALGKLYFIPLVPLGVGADLVKLPFVGLIDGSKRLFTLGRTNKIKRQITNISSRKRVKSVRFRSKFYFDEYFSIIKGARLNSNN